ncbi:hypothetical protein DY000_02051823 [Brassica cretica]|uniref:Uncharacterized protein n=1 Tax=Brassica cretica TaxID=69181 RepID=A0ABQ7AEU9_BRACR|nr:hypothetical protein DY000_02051823 [Brassica cretica]
MINSKEVKEGSSQNKVKAGKVKEGGCCECPTPNGDVIQVCKYKSSHVAKVRDRRDPGANVPPLRSLIDLGFLGVLSAQG